MVVLNSGANGPLQILFFSTPDPTNQLITKSRRGGVGAKVLQRQGWKLLLTY